MKIKSINSMKNNNRNSLFKVLATASRRTFLAISIQTTYRQTKTPLYPEAQSLRVKFL